MPKTPDPLAERQAFVLNLYKYLLGRTPGTSEAAHWEGALASGMPERELFRRFVEGKEYAASHPVIPGFPSGHFYSPIVNPAEVKDYWEASISQKADDLSGVDVDLSAMYKFWAANRDAMLASNFPDEPTSSHRYFSNDGRYPKGDALVLLAMMNSAKPKRIIEIGSGFSSAVMLDVADQLDLAHFHLTCIDPFADRLRGLLRPRDHDHVTILERKVQTVPVKMFSILEANDILFIDSSHVLKTGSDVHYELFHILPVVQRGVLIHFHDIQFPFEYPRQWVFDKRWSWNEIYAVRAFLMYNTQFAIRFFTDLFLRSDYGLAAAREMSGTKPLIGGSLWIERT